MEMHGRILHTALVQWIRSVFKEGLVLTEDVARYMDSVFGTQDVGAVLADAPDSETGPLLELLCFPERNLQMRFEFCWADCVFTAEDQSAIIAQLCHSPLRTGIKSISGAWLCPVDIPPFALASVVQRLRITWRPPPRLARTLARQYPPERRAAIRVLLRNAGFPWHAEHIRMMELFFGQMPAESDDFETNLVFLLTIMSELMPGCEARDFLFAKKQFYFKALCRAEDFERRRRSSNMEIMMLQGARAAQGDAETWRNGMRMIDTLSWTLFGETRFFQRPENERLDVAHGEIPQQIENVIRLLA